MNQNPFNLPNDIIQAEEKRQRENQSVLDGHDSAIAWLGRSEDWTTAQMEYAMFRMATALKVIKGRQTEEDLKPPSPEKAAQADNPTPGVITYVDADRGVNLVRAIRAVLDLYEPM